MVSELWFLYMTLFHNVLYQCMQFQVNSFSSLENVACKKIQNEIINGRVLKIKSDRVMILVYYTS